MSDTRDNVFKTKEKEELEENKLEKIKVDYKNFFKYTKNESKSISCELFKKHFNFVATTVLAKNYMRQKTKRKTMS